MPARGVVTRTLDKWQKVRLPEGAADIDPVKDGDALVYEFPARCEVRTRTAQPLEALRQSLLV